MTSDIKAIWPDGTDPQQNPPRVSPGVMVDGFLFVTGMTGSNPDGSMPEDPAEQFRGAFKKLNAVLETAGLSFANVVEMTSYHINIQDHFDTFAQVRSEYVRTPYPAWTAVGVAELRRAGALVEVKITARR